VLVVQLGLASPAAAESESGERPKVWLGLLIGGAAVGLAGAGLMYAGNSQVADTRLALCRGGAYLDDHHPAQVDGVDCRMPPGPILDRVQVWAHNNDGSRGHLTGQVGLMSLVLGGSVAALSAYMYFVRDPSPRGRGGYAIAPVVTPDGAGAILRVAW
jgi:hypothetical protein